MEELSGSRFRGQGLGFKAGLGLWVEGVERQGFRSLGLRAGGFGSRRIRVRQ